MIGNGHVIGNLCAAWSRPELRRFLRRTESAARFTDNAVRLRESILFKSEPKDLASNPSREAGEKYPWHAQIVTTVFWIGETPSGNNPIPNRSSAWDSNWARNFGGSDSPEAERPKWVHSGKVRSSSKSLSTWPFLSMMSAAVARKRSRTGSFRGSVKHLKNLAKAF